MDHHDIALAAMRLWRAREVRLAAARLDAEARRAVDAAPLHLGHRTTSINAAEVLAEARRMESAAKRRLFRVCASGAPTAEPGTALITIDI